MRTREWKRGMKTRALFGQLALALGTMATVAVLAAPASGMTIEEVVYDGAYPAASFDGTGSVGGPTPFPGGGMASIAVDQQTGNVYVANSNASRIYKFDAAGNPQAFVALAPATTIVREFEIFNGVDLFVDNSGGSVEGRIYAVTGAEIFAYERDGEPVPNYPIAMPGACGGDVDPDGNLWISDQNARKIVEYDPTSGEPTGETRSTSPTTIVPCDVAFDSNGNFYVNERFEFSLKKYNSNGAFLELLDDEPGEVTPRPTVDLSNDHVYVAHGSYALEYDENGILLDKFGQSSGPYPGFSSTRAVAVAWSSHKVYAPSESTFPPRVDRLAHSGVPLVVPGVTTGAAKPDGTTATLNGTVDPDGVATTDCRFEWGRTRAYTNTPVPCTEGNVLTGGSQAVTATLTGLSKGSTYHYRLSAKNANGFVVLGRNKSFIAQGKPIVSDEYATHVNSDGVRIHATIDPDGGPTAFHVEYGTDTTYGSIAPAPDQKVLGKNSEPHAVSQEFAGLQSGVEYHYRVVATNFAGTTTSSADHTFTTLPPEPVPVDECPNALARQQTGAALLLDCRAYELVSAANSNGYDVESAMVPGQKPYAAHPRAQDRVLYGMHNGGIPGTGSPTNNGVDPYVATRGGDSWTTKYVGIPSDATPGAPPFASPLAAADEGLSTFVFGGANLCDPCLPDGTSGVPLRTPNGDLAQGMAGDLSPASSLTPDGLVLERLSADGKHLVFGSAEQFEADGNSNGDVSIYDRNLVTDETQVVSKTPAGTNLPCLQGAGNCHSPGNQAGIGQLATSADGSRIVVAQRVSTDAKGNHYWHPYMHVGTSPNTIDLAPGTTAGVLFNGMTEDGSKVFITTTDKLLPLEDTDTSADIYVADVGSSGATLSLVSTDATGLPSNDDTCTPPNEPNTWNTAVGDGKCSALAFAGGAGVATSDGTFYFLSPEQLDGSEGSPDQVNLYVVRPGEDPQFVAVMDTTTGKPAPKRQDPELESPALVTGLSKPESLAVDQRNGDLYVLEETADRISRFDSSGAPKNFSSAEPHVAGNKLTEVGFWGFFSGRDQVAVDGYAGSPMEGTIYATGSFSAQVTIYANSGEKIGAIPTIEEVGLGSCGVAVDQASGTLYVAESSFYSTTRIRRFVPKNSPTIPIDASDYTETQLITSPNSPCNLSADSKFVYGTMTNPFTVGFEATGPTYKLQVGDFSSSPFSVEGEKMIEGTKASAVDSATGDVYVDELDQISRFDKFGNLKHVFGLGEIGSASAGVAIDSPNGYTYVSDTPGGSIVRYESPLPPARPIDNPAVEHAADSNGTRRHGDFQVTPDGSYAAFTMVEPVTGYTSFRTLNVYRYDAGQDELECASCMTTNARPVTDATLASHGLSLVDDGRLFFTSSEPLVLRDTDEKKDAYEWSEGTVQLISTGASQFGSEVFSATADGKDVFFFTRETLSPEDQNGSVMKIYDAREEGGWFSIPDPPQCAASDECHGPSSPVPSKAGIASLAGTEGNQIGTKPKPRKCRKGFVKRGGKCVRKRKSKRNRRTHR
jgi:sugar lactone lactonase YvrE